MEKVEKSERRYRENAKEEGGGAYDIQIDDLKSYTSRKQEAGDMRREVRRSPLTAPQSRFSCWGPREWLVVKMRLVENLDWEPQIFKPGPVPFKGLALCCGTRSFERTVPRLRDSRKRRRLLSRHTPRNPPKAGTEHNARACGHIWHPTEPSQGHRSPPQCIG
jgi:hypothetical protein